MEKEKTQCTCPECLKREKEYNEMEEINLAVLIALVPVLTITLFGNIGLF